MTMDNARIVRDDRGFDWTAAIVLRARGAEFLVEYNRHTIEDVSLIRSLDPEVEVTVGEGTMKALFMGEVESLRAQTEDGPTALIVDLLNLYGSGNIRSSTMDNMIIQALNGLPIDLEFVAHCFLKDLIPLLSGYYTTVERIARMFPDILLSHTPSPFISDGAVELALEHCQNLGVLETALVMNHEVISKPSLVAALMRVPHVAVELSDSLPDGVFDFILSMFPDVAGDDPSEQSYATIGAW